MEKVKKQTRAVKERDKGERCREREIDRERQRETKEGASSACKA